MFCQDWSVPIMFVGGPPTRLWRRHANRAVTEEKRGSGCPVDKQSVIHSPSWWLMAKWYSQFSLGILIPVHPTCLLYSLNKLNRQKCIMKCSHYEPDGVIERILEVTVFFVWSEIWTNRHKLWPACSVAGGGSRKRKKVGGVLKCHIGGRVQPPTLSSLPLFQVTMVSKTEKYY